MAQGETLSKIAKQYGLTLDQLLAANKQIKNPNKIAIGDELNIPTPGALERPGQRGEPLPVSLIAARRGGAPRRYRGERLIG